MADRRPLVTSFGGTQELAAGDTLIGTGCLRVLAHDGSTYPARPSVPAGQVRWIGPTQPTGWLTGDEWINNS